MARKEKTAPATEVNSLAAPGALESGEKVENFAGDETTEAYKTASKLYEKLQKQYDNQQQRADDIAEFWNIYNAIPDTNQQYSGNSQCYVPAVRDCVKARAKRTLKQLFPTRHKHVEAVGSTDEIPHAQLALIEHDIRATKLKSVVRSDLIAGDVTGQWNLYIDWTRSYRRITELIKRNPILETVEGEETGLVDPTDEEDATEDSDVLAEGPEVVDFADEDLAVIPPTCNDIEKSLASCIRLRMSKSKVESLVESGVFELHDGETVEQLWEQLEKASQDSQRARQNPPKARSNDAGVKTDGTFKYLLVYECHTELEFEEDGGPVKRLAYVYYASAQRILGIVKAPQWGGKRPVLSAPAERVNGSFKGKSIIDPVKFLQWNLNDYWNMGQDSAMYSLLPIYAIDPLSNPTWSSMVMGLAALWPVKPDSVKALTSPQLHKDAIQLCEAIKSQIRESMDVNELMLGKMPQGRKNNQLMQQMAQDQMTNIMDNAERYEEEMLTPLAERLFEYETQFRTASLTVVTRGEVGVKATMTEVEPQQFNERYRFQWCGTSIVLGQQLQQMRIAGMNVLRGIPPQQLNGRKLDVTPILEVFVEGLYGAEMAPRILIDERNLFTVPPETENEMMHNNLPVQIHEADDDQAHLMSHMSAARLTGDLQGKYRAHIAAHTMAMQAKMQKQMGQQQQQGQPGAPGAGPPGIGGTPRLGGQPAGQKPMQQPPGLPGADAAGPGRG